MKTRFLLLLFALIVSAASKAQNTTTVTASKITSSSVTWTGSGGETWNVVINGGATNQNPINSYAQFGTRNSPSTSGTFSTSGIAGTITSIIVDCASYNGLGTVDVTVGNAAFGTQSQSIPKWSNNAGGEVSFTGSASGAIVVTMTNGSGGRAMYIKSITVTYSSGTVTSYTIAASANPSDGGTVSGMGTYTEGTDCSLTATPAALGYAFSNWTENGAVVSTDNPYTFTVNSDRTLVANFTAIPTYTITATVDPADAGSVSGTGTFNNGSSCTLSVTANTGYSFTHWSLNGSQVSTNNPYTFTVSGNAAYVAHFSVSADYILVEASQSDWSGEYLITYYTSGTSAEVLSGSSGTATNYGTYEHVTVTDKTIAASLGDPYKVVIENVGSNTYTIKFGEYYLGWTSGNSLAFSNDANNASSTNYQWSISYSNDAFTIANKYDSTRKLQYNSSSPRFACYTSSQKAVSLFKKVVSSSGDPHNVIVASGITNGTVSVSPTEAIAGTTITVTATPDAGYMIASVTTTPATTVTGSGTSYSFTMPDSDVTVNATFTEVSCFSGDYTLVTSAVDDWSGNYVIAYGSSGTVTLLNGQNGNYGGTATATVSNSTIANSAAIAYDVTIARDGSCYTIKQGNYYLGYEGSESYLSFSTSIPETDPDQYRWVVSFENGLSYIRNAGYAANGTGSSQSPRVYYLNYYSSYGFDCFTSVDGIRLFRRVSQAPAAPQFSLLEGLYTTAQTVSITTTSGIQIYYTTDGTEPDETATPYRGPITLGSGTTTLKAVAFNGSCYSTVTTAHYALTGEVIPCSEYHLVTEEQTDWSGNYVITNMKSTTARFLNGIISEPEAQSNTYNGGVNYGTFSITDVSTDVTVIPAELVDKCKVTITKVGDYYTLKLGNYYLGMWNDVNNRLDYFSALPSGDEDKCYWSIAYNDGDFRITNVHNSFRSHLGFNNNVGDGYDHSRFACYASTSNNISDAFELYKQTLGEETSIAVVAGTGITQVSVTHEGTTENGTDVTVTGSHCTDVTLNATIDPAYLFEGWYVSADGQDPGTFVSAELPYTVPIDGNTYTAVASLKPDTWVNVVTSQPTGWTLGNIDSEDDLAWLISYVNGYNNSEAHPNVNATLTADLDMNAHIWVPIGENSTTPFTGTFEGNGHSVVGIHTELANTHAGMFGYTSGATIQNTIVQAFLDCPSAVSMGTLIGTMVDGSLSNVEGAGTLHGSNTTLAMGGLVGQSQGNSLIHSSFAVNTMTGTTNTVMGGLVGSNSGDLLNSYANAEMSYANAIGGLVGDNNGRVENCYVVVADNDFPAFAANNNGTVTACYADKEVTYVGDGTPASGSGYFDAVMGNQSYGYYYWDNTVHATNNYVAGAITYANHQIDKWPGLLSTLNQWVDAQNAGYTQWLRPTSSDINGDLPVLIFPKDNCLATTDGNYLDYSAFDRNNLSSNNGLDHLLLTYKDLSANIFLYDSTTNVANIPTANINVFINEDVALLQSDGAQPFINATVGVTFDNSCKTATDYDGNTLLYDWHLISTPLSNAPLGISYNDDTNNYWDEQDTGQMTDVSGGYLPDGLGNAPHWDFYCYYEPEYHWINFKRNSNSHYHWDEPHDPIDYQNQANLVPGKGYMVAIDKDSYLNNTGTLNGPQQDVTIELTCTDDPASDIEPTKDWGSNLIGNPYQAYLDLNKVVEGTGYQNFYVYEAENGSYEPYSYTASKNPVLPSRYIHPHQAFFVLKDYSEPEDFIFTYDMATTKKEDDSYLRGDDRVNYPLVNLFVNNERGNRDLAVIELGRPELGGAEKVNALRNSNFKLYAHFGDKNYALLFTPKDAERVPVHFKTKEDGTYTMTWSTYNGTFTSLFLVDNITGKRTDMLQEDHYTFESNIEDNTARFYLTFAFTDVEEYNINDQGDFAFISNGELIVNGEGTLQVFDALGRQLFSKHLSPLTSPGVYVLRLINGTTVRNQKIVVK